MQVDKLKENDFKKNRNTYIVDLDRTLDVLLNQYQMMMHKQRGYVQDLFNALDVRLDTYLIDI